MDNSKPINLHFILTMLQRTAYKNYYKIMLTFCQRGLCTKCCENRIKGVGGVSKSRVFFFLFQKMFLHYIFSGTNLNTKCL